MSARCHPKKPPKDLDISGNLRLLTELESPLDPTALFCRPGPVELEVGTGKGMFLTSVTLACPDRNFVGIEVSAGYARMAASRLASSSSPQMALSFMVMPCTGTTLLRTIKGIHLTPCLFPPPMVAHGIEKRRILNPEFLEHVGSGSCNSIHLHI